MDGSNEARKRLRVILETISGQRSVASACEELGISEARFHELRAEALAAALTTLEPGQAGRPPSKSTVENDEVEALKAEMMELRIDLQAARIREEIAVAMPHLLKPREGAGKKTTERGKSSSRELFGPKSGT